MNAVPVVTDEQPEEERERMKNHEELARMPLESLLYYILAGAGRNNVQLARPGEKLL